MASDGLVFGTGISTNVARIQKHSMNWLRQLFRRPVQTRIQVVRRYGFKLRMAEWRADPVLCNTARKVLDDGNVRLIVDVLRNEHLALLVLPTGASSEVRAAVQAMSEGYSMCLNNLEAMAIHQPLTKELEPTFEPPEMPNL